MVGYATGQTDEWRGTGVWSGLSLKRDSSEEDGDGNDKSDTKKKNVKTPPGKEEQPAGK